MKRSIPGFYFDEERNRYFRIQPNRATSGAQHSAQAIKDRRESSEKRKRHEADVSRRQEQRISRSYLLQHPELGGNLSTNLKIANPIRNYEIRTNILTSALRPTEAVRVYSSAYVAKLLHAPLTNELFTFQSHWPNGTESEPHGVIYTHRRDIDSRLFTDLEEPTPGLLQGTPASMEICSVSEDLVLLAICNKRSGGTIYLRQMHHQHYDGVNDVGFLSPPSAEIQFLHGGVTLWSSAPSPTSPQFVVTSSEGLHLTYADENSWNMKQLQQRHREEFLNVDWQGRNVVSAGNRSGDVVFVDIRSEGWVNRLKLKLAVSAIRSINEHQVVIRSFDSMNLYDLRYASSGRSKVLTKPWLSFQEYKSTLRPTGNFDYDETLGMIVTGKLDYAQQRRCPNLSKGILLTLIASGQPNRATIYSISTGKVVPTKLNSQTVADELTDLRFARSKRDAPSLLVAHGSIVEEWAYG